MLASFLVGSRVYIVKIDQIFHRIFKGLTFLEKRESQIQKKKSFAVTWGCYTSFKVKYLEIELKLKINGN